MEVPSDSFGGVSPERKASQMMRTFFTFVAVKVVLAQLESSGRGALASMNPEAYKTLTEMLEAHPMKDGDEWIQMLLKRNEMMAVRILEVRAAYGEQDFEWDQLQKVTVESMAKTTTKLLQEHAADSFT
eukprot:CAMPEP_0206142904 /NCGR_PEP_ID=MMETSP1473-20131121/18599_1 /ASSEMBLY_ACC=CAM_ASM_001109 /TAXON_ID=1461547 /ORGANISM="Stichococcus sp, Strain RCC1054" /LENGTH=128 /DNA_ID=CAMNT_0053538073 /DNA_START=326 /DNA_END=708 /DNA_ORIENTATION=+